MMNIETASHCPICRSTNTICISGYPNPKNSFLGASMLLLCESCKLVFASAMPEQAEIDKYYTDEGYNQSYQNQGKSGISFFQKMAMSRLDLILKYLHPDDRLDCLDVGAGYAEFGRVLKYRKENAVYDVVEPSANCRGAYGNWVNQAFESIDAVGEQYNLITLNQVLEHLVDPVTLLKKISHLLKDRGMIFIEVPHRDDLYKPNVEPHLTFWEKTSLNNLIKCAGFNCIFCESVGLPRHHAKKHFHRENTIREKLLDPYCWRIQINKVLKKINSGSGFDIANMFKMSEYGGDSQWIRSLVRLK